MNKIPNGVWDYPSPQDAEAYSGFVQLWNAPEPDIQPQNVATGETGYGYINNRTILGQTFNVASRLKPRDTPGLRWRGLNDCHSIPVQDGSLILYPGNHIPTARAKTGEPGTRTLAYRENGKMLEFPSALSVGGSAGFHYPTARFDFTKGFSASVWNWVDNNIVSIVASNPTRWLLHHWAFNSKDGNGAVPDELGGVPFPFATGSITSNGSWLYGETADDHLATVNLGAGAGGVGVFGEFATVTNILSSYLHWYCPTNDPNKSGTFITDLAGDVNAASGSSTWNDDGGGLTSVEYGKVTGDVHRAIFQAPVDDLSVSFWFRSDDIDTDPLHYPIGFERTSLATGIFITGSSFGFAERHVGVFDGTNRAEVTSSQVQWNTWTHCVVTWTAGTVKIYLDGTEQTVTTTGTIATDSFDGMKLGGRGDNSFPFDGSLDDVRVFDGIWTQAQVTALKNAGRGGVAYDSSQLPYEDTVGVLSVDDNSGSWVMSPENPSGPGEPSTIVECLNDDSQTYLIENGDTSSASSSITLNMEPLSVLYEDPDWTLEIVANEQSAHIKALAIEVYEGATLRFSKSLHVLPSTDPEPWYLDIPPGTFNSTSNIKVKLTAPTGGDFYVDAIKLHAFRRHMIEIGGRIRMAKTYDSVFNDVNCRIRVKDSSGTWRAVIDYRWHSNAVSLPGYCFLWYDNATGIVTWQPSAAFNVTGSVPNAPTFSNAVSIEVGNGSPGGTIVNNLSVINTRPPYYDTLQIRGFLSSHTAFAEWDSEPWILCFEDADGERFGVRLARRFDGIENAGTARLVVVVQPVPRGTSLPVEFEHVMGYQEEWRNVSFSVIERNGTLEFESFEKKNTRFDNVTTTTQTAQASGTLANSKAVKFTLGSDWVSSAPDRSFLGFMDTIRIWERKAFPGEMLEAVENPFKVHEFPKPRYFAAVELSEVSVTSNTWVGSDVVAELGSVVDVASNAWVGSLVNNTTVQSVQVNSNTWVGLDGSVNYTQTPQLAEDTWTGVDPEQFAGMDVAVAEDTWTGVDPDTTPGESVRPVLVRLMSWLGFNPSTSTEVSPTVTVGTHTWVGSTVNQNLTIGVELDSASWAGVDPVLGVDATLTVGVVWDSWAGTDVTPQPGAITGAVQTRADSWVGVLLVISPGVSVLSVSLDSKTWEGFNVGVAGLTTEAVVAVSSGVWAGDTVALIPGASVASVVDDLKTWFGSDVDRTSEVSPVVSVASDSWAGSTLLTSVDVSVALASHAWAGVVVTPQPQAMTRTVDQSSNTWVGTDVAWLSVASPVVLVASNGWLGSNVGRSSNASGEVSQAEDTWTGLDVGTAAGDIASIPSVGTAAWIGFDVSLIASNAGSVAVSTLAWVGITLDTSSSIATDGDGWTLNRVAKKWTVPEPVEMSTRANEVIEKQAAEVINRSMTFDNRLESSDFITGASVVVTPTTTPALTVTNVAPSSSGREVVMRISSGLDGVRYTVNVTANTDQGETLVGDGLIHVQDD